MTLWAFSKQDNIGIFPFLTQFYIVLLLLLLLLFKYTTFFQYIPRVWFSFCSKFATNVVIS